METIEKYEGSAHAFAYEVLVNGGMFIARTPYRHVDYEAETREKAIGSMLRGMVEMGRDGALHPDCPTKPGTLAPLQHVMNILTEKLEWNLARRADLLFAHYQTHPGGSDDYPQDPKLARYNEVIAGISTGIAALARVKEL